MPILPRSKDPKMAEKSATVYWLIPARAERELFRNIIRILGRQFDAPRFEPHLTLAVFAGNRETPGRFLRSLSAFPIRLSVRGIGNSSKFTKTLFVRFRSNKGLGDLIGNLARASGVRLRVPSDPHVSLLYRNLAAPMRQEIASTIRLPFREVIFDSIKIIRCTLPIRDRAAVEEWRVIATKRLLGVRTRAR